MLEGSLPGSSDPSVLAMDLAMNFACFLRSPNGVSGLDSALEYVSRDRAMSLFVDKASAASSYTPVSLCLLLTLNVSITS